MDVSLIVCAYNMTRELPRTIYTLSRPYQRNLDSIDYEIIVVDNGSTAPVDEAELRRIAPNLRVIATESPAPSPVKAINAAVAASEGRVIGLYVDGARMASPGLMSNALEAYAADPTKVIGTLGFHLGPDVQMRSIQAGYDQGVEDRLLAKARWREDGYRLFQIAALAQSSTAGWFGCVAESNAVYCDRAFWKSLGGLDERFLAPGGGFANLDFWVRAVEASHGRPWMILGEATFHQVHGGAATNGTGAARAAMLEEYTQIRGHKFAMPRYKAQYVGRLDEDLMGRRIGSPETVPRTAHSLGERVFSVSLPPHLLDSLQAGTLRTRYRGLRLAKNPLDLALYLRLLQILQPRTIIEIGSSEGGSALWFRDQSVAMQAPARVLSLDLTPPSLQAEGVAFYKADSANPRETFPTDEIVSSPRPWLVTEDSAHTYESVKAVLDYFDPLLQPRDYLVIEDGVVADLRGAPYRAYADGPNRAVVEFLLNAPDRYAIDAETCDFYGHNMTFCPNGWLVRR